jgi:PEP-CTERM motif
MKDLCIRKSPFCVATLSTTGHLLKSLALCAVLGGAVCLNAQTVTFDPSTYSDAYTYMSWTPTAYTLANYPGDGGTSAGGWSLAALPAVISGNQLTLSPNVNTYNASDTYWANPDGTGANQMTGLVYTETVGTYVNTSLTFTYDVLDNSLVSGYTAYAFISDFGPGYAFNGQSLEPLTPGVGSVTYTLTGSDPGEIVQYGFELVGPDANPATVAGLGSVTIVPQAVPEPASLAMAGLGGAVGLLLLRKRSGFATQS